MSGSGRCSGSEGTPADDVASGDTFSKELYDTLRTREFNDELYKHLNQRPEYETKELYKKLQSRIDVEDPLQGELKDVRERFNEDTLPSPEQTPGEVAKDYFHNSFLLFAESPTAFLI